MVKEIIDLGFQIPRCGVGLKRHSRDQTLYSRLALAENLIRQIPYSRQVLIKWLAYLLLDCLEPKHCWV